MWTVSEKLYNEVFFSDSVREGVTMAWETVRGFINMFYLLILIFLAISTILRINKFDDKKLFFKVIASAILVNFSMAITLVVIDFSNLIMVYFASALQDVNVVNSFFSNMGYIEAFNGGKLAFKIGADIANFIVNIVIAVMLLFTGASLLIRLIAYWVLIILSPLAFFSIALPGSNGFKEWSDKLIWYSFYGPIMLFFIWLALALSYYLGQSFVKYDGNFGIDAFVKFLTSYITVLYLLYYGHDKSKTMASKAGDFAGKIMDKGGQYAVKAGKGAAMLTPLGAGYAGYKYGESHAKGVYSGGQALLQRFNLTKGLTKKGAEEKQAKRNRKYEYMAASSDGKNKMQMEDIYKTDAKLKEKYDMESENTLKHLTENGTGDEKKAAYLRLAQMGKLKGDMYKKALKSGEGNSLYANAINRSAYGKNRVAVMKFNAENYSNPDSKAAIDKQVQNYKSLKGVKSDYTVNTANSSELERVARIGSFSKMNISGVADLINEEEEKTVDIAKEFMEYGKLSGEQLSQKDIEILTSKIKDRNARAIVQRGHTQQNRRPRGPVDENGIEDLTRLS
jgi:hypothetical protein